jgi:uncharacterized LabA/DUF88 family protein
VLVSGDSDYLYSLNLLANKGFLIHTVGVKDNIGSVLLQCSDRISYINDIPNVIGE